MKRFAKRLFTALLCLLFAAGNAAAQGTLSPIPLSAESAPFPSEMHYLADGKGYRDESIEVGIERVRAYETEITIARVRIADPSQIRTAMAGKYGSTAAVRPDKLAERVNAVLSCNGDYFCYNTAGYLVRQGVTYRENAKRTYDMLIIDENGDFTIIIDPTKAKIQEYLVNGGTIVNSFNFGPALVKDYDIVVTSKRQDCAVNKKTQRMGVGQTGPLEYLLVATEGPENPGSEGLTIPEFARLMYTLGAVQAYNMDGGSSTALMLGGKKINAPGNKKVRTVCDILYFATLVEE